MVLISSQNNLYLSSHNFFQLNLTQLKDQALLNIKFLTPFVNSRSISTLKNTLNLKLPSIFEHKCFNDNNLPFSREALNTELGHLYEHILIEYIHQFKKKNQFPGLVVKGVTSWNWNISPKGAFEIVINSSDEDLFILREAILKTNTLMSYIF